MPGSRASLSDRKWRLYTLRLGMTRLSVALVLCALIGGGIYRQRIYFTFACCAAAALLLVRAWRDFCRFRDNAPIRPPREHVPYMLRRDKQKTRHKPAFLMNSADFDDDLTPYTSFAAEDFTDAQRHLASACACGLAAVVLLIASALVR